jgi:glycosyltransferase involved in cell wall biosynthesis
MMPMSFSATDISVVIPTYNSDQTIAPLLESILMQNLLPGEIIVVDDFSKDETIRIVERYPVKLNKQEKNGGAAKARNIGIKEAKGEIILFLDSDTYLVSNVIQAIIDGFNNRGNVYAQNGFCNSEPLNKGCFPLYKGIVENSWIDDIPDWDDSSRCINARIGAFTKSSLLDVGGFDEDYSGACVEDHEFGIRYSKKYKIFLNKQLIVRHHFSNFFETVRNYWHRTYETMFLVKKHKNEVLDSGGVSRHSALQYFFGATLLIVPFASFFSYLVWVFWLTLCLIYVLLSKNVLRKFFKEGLLFGCFGSVVHAIYGLVITTSAAYFCINNLIKTKD